MCIVLCWSLWCPLVMDMQTTTGIAKPWWEVQHGTQTASCHHIMKNGLRCVQSHTPVPTSSFDMIVNTTLPRHNWHNWTSISSDCGVLYAGGREMSVARCFFADGGGGPRSALRQGQVVPFRVHHRCLGVRLLLRVRAARSEFKTMHHGAKMCKPAQVLWRLVFQTTTLVL